MPCLHNHFRLEIRQIQIRTQRFISCPFSPSSFVSITCKTCCRCDCQSLKLTSIYLHTHVCVCVMSVCVYLCLHTYVHTHACIYILSVLVAGRHNESHTHFANFSRATREAAKSKLKTAAAATRAEQRQRHIDWGPTYAHTHTHAHTTINERCRRRKATERVESSSQRAIMACERGYA